MATSFERRVALVTGGTSMLGRAIVKAFYEAGASVVFVARDGSRGRALENELDAGRAAFVQGDITDDRVLDLLVETACARIDVLVNNAVSYRDRGIESSRDDWLETLNVNLISAALLAHRVVPVMRRRGGGAIVNVGSVGGKVGARGRAVYPVSKAAMLQLTRNQAASLARDGIRVNSVSPGWTWSDALSEITGGDRAQADAVSSIVQPLGRAGTPEEVARAVIFVCSEDASFITGEDLAVDGGFAMLGPDQGRPAREWFQRLNEQSSG